MQFIFVYNLMAINSLFMTQRWISNHFETQLFQRITVYAYAHDNISASQFFLVPRPNLGQTSLMNHFLSTLTAEEV